MAKVLITESILQDTADAIREKAGTSELMTPSEFSENIDNIEIGADLSDYFNYNMLSSNGLVSAINRSIKKIPADMVCPQYMSNGFNGCTSLTEIPLLDTSNVTSMNNMFADCTNLTQVPQLNTSKVTNMISMFYYCINLTEIPLLDTSSVTFMNNMFEGCMKLTTIPQLNTSKVTSMSSMFSGCSALTEIPLLDTSNVTNAYRMFAMCTNLTTIPQLNISKVTNMQEMFTSCTHLTDTSLNNILEMCINATSYTGTKTLANILGINTTFYPASRIQSLPSYNDFIAAGWTIGY